MELILLALLFLRLVIPLAIFRWPLPGALASMIMDAVDYPVFGRTVGVPPYYSVYDKALDIYYLSIEFVVSLKWLAIPRLVSMVLYAYRLVGSILFMAMQVNALLFFFPNVFELFFILELLRAKYFSRFAWTVKRAVMALIFLLLLKLPIEYALHVRYVDPWTLLKDAILSLFRRGQ